MERQAIEKIEELIKSSYVVEVDGKTYSRHPLEPVAYTPYPTTLKVRNLRGFCAFINNDIDEFIKGTPHVITVESPRDVSLYSSLDEHKIRARLVSASVAPSSFLFGKFMPQSEFAIRLRAQFIDDADDDFHYVLSYTLRITSNTDVDIADDGHSQRVQVRKGTSGALKESTNLKGIVKLTPYRTFKEVKQPTSEFLLRVQSGDDEPEIALFEADGGMWQQEAAQNIADYIEALVPDIPVIA